MKISEGNSTSYSEFYETNLYRLQNGVLNIVKNSETPFYLTGGTALSRGFYHHRYSDDLDFFLNQDCDFGLHVESVLELLKKNGYFWSSEVGFKKSLDFCTLVVEHPDFQTKLKLDFVNDVAEHFGDFVETDLFYKTDSIRNILSNKVTAVFRMSPKDIVDIHQICKHEMFDWGTIFEEVRQKELGVEPDEVSEIIKGIPEAAFNSIKWITPIEFQSFKKDVDQIAKDMLNLSANTLLHST